MFGVHLFERANIEHRMFNVESVCFPPVRAHPVEYVLFALYVLFGPTAWIVFAALMLRGRQRLSLFRRLAELPADPPRVTILVPAKDEGERIRACLESALEQDYPNFSVIAINDRSTDRTGAFMDELAGTHPNLRVIHIADGSLPPGWTGKCNALHSSVKHADGAWLLFVDSDVILQPDALKTTMRASLQRDYDLLSLLPRVESGGFWEGMLVPLAGMAINALYATALTNADHRKSAFANGQFLLVRRSTYEAIGGHERVKDQFTEDVEMARLLKSLGYRVRLGWGKDLLAVRMYSSLAGIIRGWGRNFYAVAYGRPWKILLGCAFVLLTGFSVYLVPFWAAYREAHPINQFGGRGWLAAGVVHFCVMTACLLLIYAWSGNRKIYALLFPLGGGMLLRVFARSLSMCATGKVEWRGTSYTHRVNATSTAT
jgi:chlorobactene glucosyltransferase